MSYKKGDIVVVKFPFIMTIPEELIGRKIGDLPENIMSEVEKRLKIIFGIK